MISPFIFVKEVIVMNKISNCPAVCNIKRFFCSLSKLQLKSEYDVKLSLYSDEKSDTPNCSHSMSGTSKYSLTKILAIGAIIALLMSAVCSLISCMSCDK